MKDSSPLKATPEKLEIVCYTAECNNTVKPDLKVTFGTKKN